MENTTPMKAIRLKCLDCSAGSVKEVRLCPIHDCPLWPYRFGKRPQTAEKHGQPMQPIQDAPEWPTDAA